MVWIDAARVAANMIEIQPGRLLSLGAFVKDHVGETLTDSRVTVCETSKPVPAAGHSIDGVHLVDVELPLMALNECPLVSFSLTKSVVCFWPDTSIAATTTAAES